MTDDPRPTPGPGPDDSTPGWAKPYRGPSSWRATPPSPEPTPQPGAPTQEPETGSSAGFFGGILLGASLTALPAVIFQPPLFVFIAVGVALGIWLATKSKGVLPGCALGVGLGLLILAGSCFSLLGQIEQNQTSHY